jgi:hypothetical protein
LITPVRLSVAPSVALGYNHSVANISILLDILRRVIDPDVGSLIPDCVRYIQAWDFPSEDHAQYEELSAKARGGTLNAQERDLLDAYLQVDGLMSILRLKAVRSVPV